MKMKNTINQKNSFGQFQGTQGMCNFHIFVPVHYFSWKMKLSFGKKKNKGRDMAFIAANSICPSIHRSPVSD